VELGASVTGVEWVIGAYSLAFAGLLLATGSVGDAVGHRLLLLAGLGVFSAGSAACAVAGTTTALVAGRTVQGVGAALLMPPRWRSSPALSRPPASAPERWRRGRASPGWPYPY
jgi:MFS family permease